MSSGKGDKRRPKSVSQEKFYDNWEKIFRKKKKKQTKEKGAVMKKAVVFTLLMLLAIIPSVTLSQEINGPLAPYLQSISVTIKADRGQGSGVIVTRELDGFDGKPVKVNFVWTAGHVIRRLRTTRTIIDSKTGQSKTLVEFRDAEIVQEIIENGRRVGEKKMLASVIKYSDADEGQDLALLMVRKLGITDNSAVFYDTENDILPIGTKVFHVGSLNGQFGANSMTDGIMSQIGRILNIGSAGGGVVFDQTTVNAFPGSSGGGVFVAGDSEETKQHRGQYCGMIVRGAGGNFQSHSSYQKNEGVVESCWMPLGNRR